MANNHFLLLVAALCFTSVSAAVFVSIDCGSSDLTYTDNNLMVWSGDNYYIQNGATAVVQSSNSISHVMDSLRYFTSRKKNCYSIQAEKGGQVLVRASFFYGNYDGKSSPPIFDLQFDGNDWATVESSVTELVYYEATYVLKGDVISVCVAQTQPNQFPFISAIEVRTLDSNMYGHVDSNYALHLQHRIAYGTNTITRYPDDPYDRIWRPVAARNAAVASDAVFISDVLADNPPQQVLQNAIITSNLSDYISLSSDFPSSGVPIYLNMYFSEVTQLDATQKRSFRVFKNNQSFSDPIIPPYENVTELYVSNITVFSNTTLFLVPTPDSNRPPIINALELFFISDALTDGSNSNDVAGLSLLQTQFDTLQDWGGDPCLPAPYSWDWINCSSDATPRVTALYLNSSGLSGSLPDLSSMNVLETIDLHNNSLTGPIPGFLGTLPNLKTLNLGNNKFSGPIPTSLSKNNNLKLIVTGNPGLCTSGSSCQVTSTPTSSGTGGATSGSSKKKSSKLPAILGTTIPIFVLIWAVAFVFAILHYRRKGASVVPPGAGQNGGGNGANGNANAEVAAKIAEALLNEIKVNMEEQEANVELANQTNQQQPAVV